MNENNGQNSFSVLHKVSQLLHSFCTCIELSNPPPYKAGYRPPSSLPPGGTHGIRHAALVFPGGHFPGTTLRDDPQMDSNTRNTSHQCTCTHHCTHCLHGDMTVGAVPRVV